MLSFRQKRLYFTFASPLMALNAWRYRAFCAPRQGNDDFVKVHLGPGQVNYIDGWINVDANTFTAKCDVWANFNRRLPFNDLSVDALYSHHVIEHLSDIERHLVEVYRILKPGGVYRVGAPNGDSAIRKFLDNDSTWFGDFPKRWESVGGRLNNFILCNNEHLHIITESYLKELGGRAGFRTILKGITTRETSFPFFQEVFDKEWESDFDFPRTLILEYVK